MLYREFHETYTNAVSPINYHHLSILVDIMTYGGHLMPISRHGINRTDNSPLTKASFEETQEQLSEAAVYGVLDNMKSVSSCAMIAQTTRSGTCGPFDIIYDYKNKGISVDDIDNIFEPDE
jgi:DNA-directed RNA polymerase II subunit RPB1